MSENFPFNTASEFLKATEKKATTVTNARVNVASPAMPDTTPMEKAGIAAAGVGIIAFTQSSDQTIQLATIICSTIAVVASIVSNAWVRGKRNDRIAHENATTIVAAADIHMAAVSEEE